MNDSTLFDEVLKLTLQRDAGGTTDEELARLERLLGESREAVVYYLKIVDDALAIRESAEARASVQARSDVEADVPAEFDSCEVSVSAERRAGWPANWLFFAAACLLLATTGMLLLWSDLRGTGSPPAHPKNARVVNLSGVEWS